MSSKNITCYNVVATGKLKNHTIPNKEVRLQTCLLQLLGFKVQRTYNFGKQLQLIQS